MGHTCIAPDLPIEDDDADLEDWASAVIDALSHDTDKDLVIVGHSMGGLVARWYIEKCGGAEVTRKLIWVGEAAAAVVGCVVLAFGVQQWQLSNLRGQWSKIEPKVTELSAMQDEIKQFRDFYDAAARNVSIWAKLAELFPKDNSVSLKTLEVRDQGNVTCTGVARDNDAFDKLFAKLSDATNEISSVHPETSGQKPVKFTVNFQWQGGLAYGN